MTTALTTLALLAALLFGAATSTTNEPANTSKGINPVQHSE